MVRLVLVAWFELNSLCVIAGSPVWGRCEGMGIGEWIAAGGCGVGWKERCGENVLTALVCRRQT